MSSKKKQKKEIVQFDSEELDILFILLRDKVEMTAQDLCGMGIKHPLDIYSWGLTISQCGLILQKLYKMENK